MPIGYEQFNAMSEPEKLRSLFDHVQHLYEAFPEKNPETHCEYHEAKIRAAQAEERFWTELKLDIAKKGVWGILVILVGLMMVGGITYLKNKLGG